MSQDTIEAMKTLIAIILIMIAAVIANQRTNDREARTPYSVDRSPAIIEE